MDTDDPMCLRVIDWIASANSLLLSEIEEHEANLSD